MKVLDNLHLQSFCKKINEENNNDDSNNNNKSVRTSCFFVTADLSVCVCACMQFCKYFIQFGLLSFFHTRQSYVSNETMQCKAPIINNFYCKLICFFSFSRHFGVFFGATFLHDAETYEREHVC